MRKHLNTLFVSTQGAYISRERENLVVKADDQIKLRVPLHLLAGVVCFGRIGLSTATMSVCGERGIPISLLTRGGRFKARITGPTSGNVLLRREQYRASDDGPRTTVIARDIVTAKILNSRHVLLRALRENPDTAGSPKMKRTASRLSDSLDRLSNAHDVDSVRGVEGEAARNYFSVFDSLLKQHDQGFTFNGRNKRPPRDRVNALLSFAYALLLHDVRAAAETTGLDPSVGFLHRDRPGRPSLALDLMEEMRAFFADRLVLTLINRSMIKASDFDESAAGAVSMNESCRETFLKAYQKRKSETLRHPFLGEETTVGNLWYIQSLLFARHLRGELDAYPPFLWK